ncbi:uncharacterized protein N7483_009191 [Penicillium malachiteum]|uniref:uncharacterized protein n=1 Tax=Penicillium malachiteum TaxID=1324776 RepID=UPI00254715E7|nr:uncharacterized protein N7483_009191 [Penicillium malachiteum]KAJ5721257.1 hypothetical protein N7483_009191 [Penicillium malachiteum]
MNYFPINLEGGLAVDSWHFILMEFLGLSKKSIMLEKALAAVSCIYLGKITNNDSVLRHGVTLYNQAIRILANMLRRGLVTDDVLYTTVVFQVLEV